MPVTWILIAIWIGVYVWSFRADADTLAGLHRDWGLFAPEWRDAVAEFERASLSRRLELLRRIVLPLFTHQFWNGGVMHLAVNVVFFQLFGGRMEARAGSLRFGLFHLLCGTLAGLAQAALAEQDRVAVGSSGAIAGSVAAYSVLYFRSHALLLIPVVVIPVLVHIRTVLLVPIWAALQIRPISRLLEIGPAEPVAWWAQAGGLVAGLGLLPLVVPARRRRR